MEKAFVLGSGMYHAIYRLGSKFIFFMVYILSNIIISVHSLHADWLNRVEVRGEFKALSTVKSEQIQGS